MFSRVKYLRRQASGAQTPEYYAQADYFSMI
jgi:hypothetical protein